jgi:hypothetical protein
MQIKLISAVKMTETFCISPAPELFIGSAFFTPER